MPNTMRWRYGDTWPLIMPAAEEPEVCIGDLLVAVGTTVRPFPAMPPQSSEGATLCYLVDEFVGVAMQHSSPGEANFIRVATSAVFEFDCLTEDILTNNYLAPVWLPHEGHAEPQKVVRTPRKELAIGLCAKGGQQISKVLVSIDRRKQAAQFMEDLNARSHTQSR